MNSKSVVAVVECRTYDRESVQSAVQKGIDLIGGLSKILNQDDKTVLLKPNVLSGKSPEKCVTTHPEVFRAVATNFLKNSYTLTYGDSPAIGKIGNVLSKVGLKQVADELGITLADFENGEMVSFSDGRRIKQFKLANGVRNCDAIVSLAKMKTHNLTRMTGAVKNQFGCIPGFSKAEFHVKLPDARDFSEMLVDLNRLLRPKLFVMDAIQAMEGNGPGNGEPVDIGCLLFGTDPVALDSVACLIMNIAPEKVWTNTIGEAWGLGNCNIENIEIVGDDWQKFVRKDFNIYRGAQLKKGGTWKYNFARKYITSKPVINPEVCQKCNVCVEQCPVVPKALSWKDESKVDPPAYDYQKCIRCYCCQEVCPYGAIYAKTPVLRKIFDQIYPF